MLYGFEPVQCRLVFLRGHARAALERVVRLVRCFVAEPNGPHIRIFHGADSVTGGASRNGRKSSNSMEPIVGIKRVCFFAAAPGIMEGNPDRPIKRRSKSSSALLDSAPRYGRYR